MVISPLVSKRCTNRCTSKWLIDCEPGSWLLGGARRADNQLRCGRMSVCPPIYRPSDLSTYHPSILHSFFLSLVLRPPSVNKSGWNCLQLESLVSPREQKRGKMFAAGNFPGSPFHDHRTVLIRCRALQRDSPHPCFQVRSTAMQIIDNHSVGERSVSRKRHWPSRNGLIVKRLIVNGLIRRVDVVKQAKEPITDGLLI